MKAVILVGGEGTRLRPLTCHTPKPMLPLVNRPFLEHVIEYLKGHGIDEVVLSMCYRPDSIRDHFGDGELLGARLAYEVETMPLGTAGGVKNVERYIDGTFFVFNGDILTDLDLGAMLAHHRQARAKATIALTPVDNPTAYGLVETVEDGRVSSFVEKPAWDKVTTNLINAGTYILEPEVLNLVPPGEFYMFERGLFPQLLAKDEPVYGYQSDAYWLDIGTPEKYLTAHHDVLTRKVNVPIRGEAVGASVWIGEDCRIAQSAVLSGPIVIGNRVTVAEGASLVGPLAIGNDCAIGAGASIEGAVIWDGTSIGSHVAIKKSLIGTRVEIAAGAVLLDGTVIADGCSIGAGNRLERGIRIWPNRKIESETITF